MRYYEIICEIICDTMWHYVCICIIQQELWLPSVPFSHHLRVEVISARYIPFKAHSLQARDGKGWQGLQNILHLSVWFLWYPSWAAPKPIANRCWRHKQKGLRNSGNCSLRAGVSASDSQNFSTNVVLMWCLLLMFLVSVFFFLFCYCCYSCYCCYLPSLLDGTALILSYLGPAAWLSQLQFCFSKFAVLCRVLLNVQAHPIQNFNRHLGSKWQSSADVHCLFVYLFSLGSFFCKTLSSTSHFLGAMHCMALWHEWKLHCCICTVRLCAPILRVQLHVQPVFPSA